MLAGFRCTLLQSCCWFAVSSGCRRTETHLYGASSKPINSYDVELVAAPGESFDNYCKGRGATADYSYTHVWQPAASELATAAEPGRRCCRDHVYESPTCDEHAAVRVFPPYYHMHSAAACDIQPRGRTVIQLSQLTTQDQSGRHQQQQQEEQDAKDEGGQVASDDEENVQVHEWYQPCRGTTTTSVGHELHPVDVCRTSSLELHHVARTTDNHYT